MQNIFSSFQKTINILTVETPFGDLVVQSNLLSKEDVAIFKKHFENVKTEEEFAYLYEKLQEVVLKQPEVKVPFQEGFDILQEITKDFKGFGDFEKVFQQEDIHKQFDGLTKEFGNMFDLHTVIFKTKPKSEPEPEQPNKEEEKPFYKVQVDEVEEEVKEIKEVEVVEDSVEMSDIDREIARLQKLKAEREIQKEAENRLIQRKELTLEINKLVAELESKKVDLLNVFDNPEVRETTYQEMKNLDSKIKSLQSKLDEF